MSECRMTEQCAKRFDTIDATLSRIDVAMRGNGTIGITTRVDRLEQGSKRISRLMWLVVGGAIGGWFVIVTYLVSKGAI